MDQTSQAPSGPPRWLRSISLVSLVIVLSTATAWNVTRSDALGEAQRAYARTDLPGCLQYALDHLERQPWSRDAALLAARCFSRMNYSEQAEPYFRRAGDLSINDMQLRAYGLARGPHPEHAIPVYRAILERSPDNVIAMRRLAAVLLMQTDAPRLMELADRLSRIPAGEVFGAMLRGTVYHNELNPQMAVASFERVLQLDPQLRDMPAFRKLFWRQLTFDLIECGRMEDAASRLEQALADVEDAELLDSLGYTFFLRGDLDEAERCYHQASEWDPTYYRPHLNLAKLYLQLRRRDEAVRELNQAQRLAPRQYSVLYTLALMYRQLGQTAEAEHVQEQIKGLREAPPSIPGIMKPRWPRYSL